MAIKSLEKEKTVCKKRISYHAISLYMYILLLPLQCHLFLSVVPCSAYSVFFIYFQARERSTVAFDLMYPIIKKFLLIISRPARLLECLVSQQVTCLLVCLCVVS